MANQATQVRQAKQVTLGNGKTVGHKSSQGFRDLHVWQQSFEMALQVYAVTKKFPKEHRFELTSQLIRASLSIPTNIAEGSGALHRSEFVQFLNIALRSTNEVEMLLLFSNRLTLITDSQLSSFINACTNIRRMLIGLIKSLESTGQ